MSAFQYVVGFILFYFTVQKKSVYVFSCFMQAVNNFKNETGYTKHARKLVQNSAPPPPRLQLLRQSRQQDPLVSNASAAAPSNTNTQVQAPTPAPVPDPSPPTLPHVSAAESQVASPAPPAVDHQSPPKTVNHGEPPPPG